MSPRGQRTCSSLKRNKTERQEWGKNTRRHRYNELLLMNVISLPFSHNLEETLTMMVVMEIQIDETLTVQTCTVAPCLLSNSPWEGIPVLCVCPTVLLVHLRSSLKAQSTADHLPLSDLLPRKSSQVPQHCPCPHNQEQTETLSKTTFVFY